jgi:hypothetical protein
MSRYQFIHPDVADWLATLRSIAESAERQGLREATADEVIRLRVERLLDDVRASVASTEEVAS